MVPTLIAGSACQADDGPFRITKVEFDNDSTITLTFSEPIAPVDGVNPDDFRLSFAVTSAFSYVYEGLSYHYEYTSYNDVAYVIGDYYSFQPFAFMSVTRGAAANQLVLRSVDALGPEACDTLDNVFEWFETYAAYYSDDTRFDAALFLHYAGGDVPIESEAGGVLADIGADWVTSQDINRSREGFGFTALAPQLRIPCP